MTRFAKIFLTLIGICPARYIIHSQTTTLLPADSIKIQGTSCGGAKILAKDTFYFSFCGKADSILKIAGHKVAGTSRYLVRNLALNCKDEQCRVKERENQPRWKSSGGMRLCQFEDLILGLNIQTTDLYIYDHDFNLRASFPFDFPFPHENASYYHNYFAHRPMQVMGDKLYIQLLLNRGLGPDGKKVPSQMPLFGIVDIQNIDLHQKIPDTLWHSLLSPDVWFGEADKRIESRQLSYFYNYFSTFQCLHSEGILLYNDGLQYTIQVFDREGSQMKSFGNAGKYASPTASFNYDNSTSDSVIRDYYRILNTTQYFGMKTDETGGRLFMLYSAGIGEERLNQLSDQGKLRNNRDFEEIWMSRPTFLQVYDVNSRKLIADIQLAYSGDDVLGTDGGGLVWIVSPPLASSPHNALSVYGYRLEDLVGAHNRTNQEK